MKGREELTIDQKAQIDKAKEIITDSLVKLSGTSKTQLAASTKFEIFALTKLKEAFSNLENGETAIYFSDEEFQMSENLISIFKENKNISPVELALALWYTMPTKIYASTMLGNKPAPDNFLDSLPERMLEFVEIYYKGEGENTPNENPSVENKKIRASDTMRTTVANLNAISLSTIENTPSSIEKDQPSITSTIKTSRPMVSFQSRSTMFATTKKIPKVSQVQFALNTSNSSSSSSSSASNQITTKKTSSDVDTALEIYGQLENNKTKQNYKDRLEKSQIKFTNQNLLNKIGEKLLLLDQLQYPNPPYTVQKLELISNGQKRNVFFTEYDPKGIVTLSDAQIAYKTAHNVAMRKLSIIAGILTHINSPDFLDIENNEQKKLALIDTLTSISNQILDGLNKMEPIKKKPIDIIDDFIKSLGKEVKKINKDKSDKDIIHSIWKGESYFIAEHDSTCIYATKSTIYKNNMKDVALNDYQIDIPFNNKLTQNLKEEYCKIHSQNDLPLWFSSLKAYEQTWLRERVPKQINDDWTNFESIFQTSAMQNLPGLKNARTNVHIIKDNDQTIQISQGFKTSTLVPYQTPAKEQGRITELNVELDITQLRAMAQQNRERKWGRLLGNNTNFKYQILIQSLLSDVTILAGADARLVNKQHQAVETVKTQFSDCDIYQINDATNAFKFVPAYESMAHRKLKSPQELSELKTKLEELKPNSPENLLHILEAAKSHFNKEPMSSQWKENYKIIQTAIIMAQGIMQASEKNVMNDQEKEDLMLMVCAIRQLFILDIGDYSIDGMNRSLFKAAYMEILVDAMGGASNEACKSGKDRTGLAIAEKVAMLRNNILYDDLPTYQNNKNKSKYIDLVAQTVVSGAITAAAQRNTIGCPGIKDTGGTTGANILHGDVRKMLGQTDTYSYNIASTNKPPLFQAAEAYDREMRKTSDNEVKKTPSPPRLS